MSAPLKYLSGYAPELLDRVHRLIDEGRLAESIRKRYDEVHEVRTDRSLYDYVTALKSQYLRNAEPISKVAYDNRLHIIQNALGTHTTVSRVQGTSSRPSARSAWRACSRKHRRRSCG